MEEEVEVVVVNVEESQLVMESMNAELNLESTVIVVVVFAAAF